MNRITLTARRFHFSQLVHSHGWAWLAPFQWDETAKTLSRPMTLGQGRHIPVTIRVRQTGASCWVTVAMKDAISPQEREIVRSGVRRMLRLLTQIRYGTCATATHRKYGLPDPMDNRQMSPPIPPFGAFWRTNDLFWSVCRRGSTSCRIRG